MCCFRNVTLQGTSRHLLSRWFSQPHRERCRDASVSWRVPGYPLWNQAVLHPSTSTFSCYHHCHRCIHSLEPGRRLLRRSCYVVAYENAMWRRLFFFPGWKSSTRTCFQEFCGKNNIGSWNLFWKTQASFSGCVLYVFECCPGWMLLMHLFQKEGFSCQYLKSPCGIRDPSNKLIMLGNSQKIYLGKLCKWLV